MVRLKIPPKPPRPEPQNGRERSLIPPSLHCALLPVARHRDYTWCTPLGTGSAPASGQAQCLFESSIMGSQPLASLRFPDNWRPRPKTTNPTCMTVSLALVCRCETEAWIVRLPQWLHLSLAQLERSIEEARIIRRELWRIPSPRTSPSGSPAAPTRNGQGRKRGMSPAQKCTAAVSRQ
jgi:hypothetical protein